MADQCIVCLEDLDVVPDPSVHHALRDAGAVAAPTEDLPTPHPSTTATPQPIALIKPCNHVLHDECLREWSQKANSCPICRHAFNVVEVLDKVGGTFSPPPYNNFLSSSHTLQPVFGTPSESCGSFLLFMTQKLYSPERSYSPDTNHSLERGSCINTEQFSLLIIFARHCRIRIPSRRQETSCRIRPKCLDRGRI